jgi:hypothetical protein
MLPNRKYYFLKESYLTIIPKMAYGVGTSLIDGELAAFLESTVLIMVATRDAAFRSTISRSAGARLHDGGSLIDVFIAGTQWPDTADNLEIGAPIAITFSRASDYRTYQIKGIVESVQPVDADECAYTAHYLEALKALLEDLGITRSQSECVFAGADYMRVRLRPKDVFAQTPGPGAGQRLSQVPQ